MTTAPDLSAPAYDPGAEGLPWWRRAIAQGAGYFLPSSFFVVIPLIFLDPVGSPTWWLALAIAAAILVFFLGTTLVAHWPETWRWLWLVGLMSSILLLGWVSEWQSRPGYFAAYVTCVAAVLIAWRDARVVILAVSLGAVGLSIVQQDMFGVIMGLMAFALGWSIGQGIDAERTRAKLREAEERTAVLAVAAERERIGRDLHDILGHSLTTIAVKADLVERLVGRNDDAARAEIASLAEVTRQALADVRATASGMREVRLAAEVASARSVLDAAGVECRTPSALPVLDDARSEVFGYVVREAVTNVVRHAGATVCTITADEGSVGVADDGRGMSERATRTGLRGLAERVEAAGGRLTVTSSPGGTTVHATLPSEGAA